MKRESIPDHVIKMMSKSDRKELKLITSDEAQAAYVAKSEKDLQTQISQFLRVNGIWFYNARMDKKTTARKGCPDYLLAWGYQPVAIEVKFGKGKLSEDQVKTHNEMLKNGWRVHTVNSLEQLKQILDALEQEHLQHIKF